MNSANFILLFTCFAGYLCYTSALNGPPPVSGPLLPVPSNLSHSVRFREVLANLTQHLDVVLKDSKRADFPVQNTSFSVALTSVFTPPLEPILWEYHYLAPEHDENGTSIANGNSQYLIASQSKVFSGLLSLKHTKQVPLESPITEYIPELAIASNSSTRWNQVTVGDLTTHLSGIAHNYGFPEIFDLVPLYSALGFPSLPNSSFPPCGVISLNEGCSVPQYLENIALSTPVMSPNTHPAYADAPYHLLGIILSRATNKTFAELLKQDITDPLNMTNTAPSPGDTSKAVIPPGGQSSWGSNFSYQAPAGGLYSSTNDLAKFARAILNHSILENEAMSRAWLKPLSSLSNDGTGLTHVGRPWEIYYVGQGQLTKDKYPNRPGFDIYAKDGGVVQYYSRLALIEEYGIGMTCLTAGEVGAIEIVTEAVMATLIPALEDAAREQAEQLYSGTYLDDSNNVEVNMTIALDDGPGLRLANVCRNGSDILQAIKLISDSGVVVAGELSTDFRLYPMHIQRAAVVKDSDGPDRQVVLEDWRIGFDTQRFPLKSELLSRNVFKNSVSSWQGLDGMYYGGQAVDRVVFVKDATTGQVLSAQLPALRADIRKAK